MKISEVIKELETLKEKYGDLNCKVYYHYPKRISESYLNDILLATETISNENGEEISREEYIAFIGKSPNIVE